MSLLAVNADDFGLHPDIDRGILECVEAGVVQSVSVVVTGGSVDGDALRAMGRRGVSAGLHLTWVGERWLTDGRLYADWRALVRALAGGGRALRDALEREAREQAERFGRAGLSPTHLDSHQHLHLLPGLWQLTARLADELGGARVRLPLVPSLRLWRFSRGFAALQALALWRARGAGLVRRCIGITRSGRNTVESLRRELGFARGRDTELVAHPGVTTPALAERYAAWGYDWSGERLALLDPAFKDAVAGAGFRPLFEPADKVPRCLN